MIMYLILNGYNIELFESTSNYEYNALQIVKSERNYLMLIVF